MAPSFNLQLYKYCFRKKNNIIEENDVRVNMLSEVEKDKEKLSFFKI